MDLELSDDEAALQEGLRSFLAGRFPMDVVRSLATEGLDRGRWSELAETGELELAVATFEGALGFHPDFADVHFHLANTLERLDRGEEAEAHFRTFLALAPESPWAEAARDRLGASVGAGRSSYVDRDRRRPTPGRT